MHDAQRANEIYLEIKDNLAHLRGKIVAIETSSGDYFIADNVLEATDKGREKYPGDTFFFKKIGYKAVYFHGCVPQ